MKNYKINCIIKIKLGNYKKGDWTAINLNINIIAKMKIYLNT